MRWFWKYLLAGCSFGAAFPLLAFLVTKEHHFFIILTAPVVLGLFALAIGLKHEKAKKYYEQLEHERNEKNKALINKAKEQALLYQNALDAVAIVGITDNKGYFTHANNNFLKISGYSHDDLLGQRYNILKSGIMSEDFYKELWETISSGKNWEGDICNRAKDGSVFWVNTMIFPQKDEKNQIIRFVCIQTDITQSKLNEHELLKSKEEAISEAKIKSDFLSTMSHEIRTPMNGIIGLCDILLDTIENKKQREQLEIIKNSGETLLTIINDILDFSKIEANKIELEQKPLSIQSVIRETTFLFQKRANEKNIKIITEFEPESPNWIIGDSTRIKQILSNLISNSLKFTHQGSIKISLNRNYKSKKTSEIQVSVADTGVGIPDHAKDKLFHSFTQVDASTTREYGGTGLGLSISKGLCEAMRGRIWFESIVGKGTTFHFTVLTEECAEQRVVETLKNKTEKVFDQSMAIHHPLKILIAEDNDVNQIVLKQLLAKFGYTAEIVDNGLKAVLAVEKNHYDVVLMDCHMPEMDGYTASQNIKQSKEKKGNPKVIAVTASSFKEDIEKCYQAGMDDFLSKPITPQSLSQILIKYSGGSMSKTFNLLQFQERFSNMDDIAKEISEQFIQTAPVLIKNIEDSIQHMDSKKLELHAHTFKGAASNFYATQVVDLAFQLEKMGKSNNLEDAQKTFQELKKQANLFIDELKQTVSQLGEKSA